MAACSLNSCICWLCGTVGNYSTLRPASSSFLCRELPGTSSLKDPSYTPRTTLPPPSTVPFAPDVPQLAWRDSFIVIITRVLRDPCFDRLWSFGIFEWWRLARRRNEHTGKSIRDVQLHSTTVLYRFYVLYLVNKSTCMCHKKLYD